jgi:uncharacterized protein (TIGR02145 family)
MKKLITLILGIAFVYSCSTSTDGNGNTTAAPIPPSNLTGTVASSTQINLSWTDNSTNETGFKIERKSGSGTYAVVGTTATDVTTFNDTGLTASTTYTYRVYSYNAGGNSPTYSNELNLTTLSASVQLPNVTIGTQIWTSTNLDVTTYSDGTPIPNVSTQEWYGMQTGAWCYYNNDPANGAIYGKLYNWYAVAGIYDNASLNNPLLRKKLAPQGWHLPSDSEWNILTTFLGGNTVAGGKMKSTGTTLWQSPNTGATNSSGFTGLPGGSRSGGAAFVTFSNLGRFGHWWSFSEFSTSESFAFQLYNDFNQSTFNESTQLRYGKKNGFSVRCVKD